MRRFRRKHTGVPRYSKPTRLAVGEIQLRLGEMARKLAEKRAQRAEEQRIDQVGEQTRRRFNSEIAALEGRLESIRSSPANRKSLLKTLFTGSSYVEEAQRQIDAICETIRVKRLAMPSSISSSKIGSLDREISGLEKSIAQYERELGRRSMRDARKQAEIERKSREKEVIAELKARAASATGKSRKLAASLRRQLAKDHNCPYCERPLGTEPHADHIYPISKGGLSVQCNMVFVCEICNAMKSDLTLATFISRYQLPRERIERRLAALGKEF